MILSIKSKNQGFTLLELLIATSIFSLILLICTFGLIQIGKNYSKGASIVRTQNSARDIMDNITQAIQYGNSVPKPEVSSFIVNPGSDEGVFCIGNSRYTYILNSIVEDDTHGLVVDDWTGGCAPDQAQDLGVTPLTTSSKELLGARMRLSYLEIKKSGEDYSVKVKVTSGDLDQSEANGSCKSGNYYCAASELQTVVHRRVN